MNVKQVLPLLCVLVLCICSCDVTGNWSFPPDQDNNVAQSQPRMFWAFNYRNSQYYQTKAELISEGKYCTIWKEQGTKISLETAKNIADVFDNQIYPKMMDTFGIYGNMVVYGEIVAQNTLELADWLGDGDGKLAILFLDIQDNYVPGVNQSRTAGYFYRYDLHESWTYSNGADLLYIDTNPGRPGTEESFKTIAHEMQHLMNYVTSALLRRRDDTVHEMDTWINEGLSAIAEWVYSEQHSEDRWVYYNADPSGLIQKGNNFFVWGNHKSEHNYAELDDYATVYLFFHWLRIQAGSNSIFAKLISSTEYNYRAVTQAANDAIKGQGYDDWGTLLKSWLAANYLNVHRGPYGYKNDVTLRNIKAKTVPEGTQKIRLYPGEGVFSVTMSGFSWPDERTNIKYVGLTTMSPWLNDHDFYLNGALLTYNTNTNENGNSEEGKTSGIASNIDTTVYEQRIRALLSSRTIDVSGTPISISRNVTPGPAMTEAAVIKLE